MVNNNDNEDSPDGDGNLVNGNGNGNRSTGNVREIFVSFYKMPRIERIRSMRK